VTRDFNPTHELRGLELEYFGQTEAIQRLSDGGDFHRFRTSDGISMILPMSLVTKIVETPHPGEVWRYDDPTADAADPYPLVLITDDGDGFRCADSSYEKLMIPYDLKNMTKILNADGTPA
jgi:hypothetical protein